MANNQSSYKVDMLTNMLFPSMDLTSEYAVRSGFVYITYFKLTNTLNGMCYTFYNLPRKCRNWKFQKIVYLVFLILYVEVIQVVELSSATIAEQINQMNKLSMVSLLSPAEYLKLILVCSTVSLQEYVQSSLQLR